MRLVEFNKKLLGPHEQQEISLMLAGKKPAALLGMTPEIRKLVRQGKIKAFKSNAYKGGYFFTLPGEEDRAEKLKVAFDNLKNAAHNTHIPEDEARAHIEIGKLLGYSKQSIRYFIKRNYPVYAKELFKTI